MISPRTEAPRPLLQALELTRKDLRLEVRAGEALLVTAPFGGVALLLVPLAVGTDVPMLRSVGSGMYWAVVLLFGVLITLRQSAVDAPQQVELLRLTGIHPAVQLLGRAGANAVLLLAFELAVLPVAVIVYDPPLNNWPWLVLVLPLVAIGLAVLGTLAGALTQGLAGRTTLGPLLVVPLALPLLLAATQTAEATRYGRPPWNWLALLLLVDLVAALAVVLSARSLEEGS
ncbi:heme exporter protein CcmB [Klenkia terrae]|uniref:Heme exporter protein CcmB n=1 Tax=Klenkia terrae TaxID=1052259 RepID=A0ABU8E4U3_9ACTN|nr:heme exporter protein CcmB [Klenkia terrae]